MTKRNSSGLRNAGTIATVAALTLGMAGPGVMTATADENTANGNNGSSETQTAKDTEYTTTVAGTPVTFEKDANGDYAATVATVKGKFQNQVVVSGTDKSQNTLTTSQKPDTNGKITGSVVYTSAADSAPKFTLTVTDYEIVDKIVDDQATQPWNATVDGKKTYPLGVKGDTASAVLDQSASYPGDITVTNGATTITLTPVYQNVTVESGDKLGQLNVSGTAVYKQAADATKPTPAFNVTLPFAYTSGTPVTVDGTETELTKVDGGKYHADYAGPTLDESNKPSTDTVTLTGIKTTLPIQWGKDVQVVDKGTGDTASKFVRLTGTASGEVTIQDDASKKSVTVPVEVDVTADRAQDKSFTGLTVTRTNAKGETTVYDGAKDFNAKFNPSTHEYTLTLPADAVGDSYTLGLTHGVDAQASKPTLALGEGASRVLKVNVNGADYTVNVKFQPADLKADSPAKLTGLYVNKTGENTKGQLIDNWDPNRLDYVLALGEKDPSPYVLPEAPDGVTIKGGNITQNAQSTRQEWIVTDTATGVSRTYSLTVTRPVKTAVTEFKPADPAKQDSTVDPESQQDTNLASHGYTGKDGKYVVSDKGSYEIPEGGTFAYEPKNGQSATVTVAHEGMTYTYTVNVLAPDGSTFAQHTYTVTYITAATHKAQLTGILVDGTAVKGFDPARHEYNASVNDPDEWMVSPQYDKASGMTVSTEKKGADATITVTSGDGLVKTTYKVHVTRKPFGGNGNNALGLASTGVGGGTVAFLSMALMAMGAVLGLVARRRQRGRSF
ncbi:hypothetical protein MCC10074_0778 [Bifidobacterium longum subsp. longum]|uniref:hypothetical protein n=1 Tax=Bifidobacterium longum TaxID=216816 RepID=UPI00103F7D56|nr:hypothetical protein [Bifidobacterium longum]TCE92847.1 hypothetical protein MCC10074_0778 [Bifidobacterium longum subsp. longum]